MNIDIFNNDQVTIWKVSILNIVLTPGTNAISISIDLIGIYKFAIFHLHISTICELATRSIVWKYDQ